jgi:hypothetical protein
MQKKCQAQGRGASSRKIVVALRTAHGVWRRSLFIAPCLIKGSIPKDIEADFV